MKADGSVIAWGNNSSGQSTPPAAALSGIVAIAAGLNHGLALKSDGSVIAWGASPAGLQSGVPIGAQSGVIAIAASDYHNLALKADGSVVAWGSTPSAPSSALSGVVSIAAGAAYSVALKADDTLVCWGTPPSGGFPPATLNRVAGVVAGPLHIATLRQDGGVQIWGQPDNNLLTIPSGASGASALALGQTFAAALKPDGTLVVWGPSGAPQLSPPVAAQSGLRLPAQGRFALPVGTTALELRVSTPDDASPDRVPLAAGNGFTGMILTDGTTTALSPPVGTTNLAALAAGGSFLVGLKNDGTVVTWGGGAAPPPTVPAGLANVVAVSATNNCGLALTRSGTVTPWGSEPVVVNTVPSTAQSGVVAIDGGGQHVLALKSNGSVVAWGSNFYGQTTVPAVALSGVIMISAGTDHSVAIKADGSIVFWGRDIYGGFSNSTYSYTLPRRASRIVSGNGFSALLYQDGSVTLFSTGTSAIDTSIPSGALSGVVDLVAGTSHLTVLKADGSTLTWGSFPSSTPAGSTLLRAGPPGVAYSVAATRAQAAPALASLATSAGALTPAFAPATLAYTQSTSVSTRGITTRPGFAEPLAGVEVAVNGAPSQRLTLGASLDGGGGFNLGITPLGAVTVWGLSGFSSVITVPTAASSDVISVAAGTNHALALKADGSLVTWGDSSQGLATIPALASFDVAAISSGAAHNLALKRDGSVVAWGSNSSGQCIVPSGALSGVIAIAAGDTHSLALKADGSVLAWGNTGASLPVAAQSGVTAIAAGNAFSVALKSDGTVIAWGTSANGLDGTVLAYTNPAVAIAAGSSHFLALFSDGTVATWGSTSSGLASVPASASGARVVAISAGNNHSSVVRSDGSVVTWGGFSSGTSSTDPDIRLAAPLNLRLPLRPGQNRIALRTTAFGSVPLAATPVVAGRNRNWFINHLGQSDSLRASASSPTLTTPSLSALRNNVSIASGEYGEYAVHLNGTVEYISGPTGVIPSDLTTTSYSGDPALRPRAVRVAVAQNFAVALLEGGTLRAWGSPSTIPVDAQSGIVAIAAGRTHMLALRGDGRVVAWDSSSGSTLTQVPGAAASGVVAIAGGADASVALKADGSLVAWGTPSSAILTALPTSADFSAIVAGDSHAVALRRDGTTVAWGQSSSQTTIPISAQTDVVYLSAQGDHTLALKGDGTVVIWGGSPLQPSGDLKLLTAPTRTYSLAVTRPLPDPLLTGLSTSAGLVSPAFSSGSLPYTQTVPYGTRAVALLASLSEFGQAQVRVNGSPYQITPAGPTLAAGGGFALGISRLGSAAYAGSTSSLLNTIPVAAQSDLIALAAGSTHALALRSDGTPVTWGASGTSASILAIPSPAQFDVAAIAARGSNSLALLRSGVVVGWGLGSFHNTLTSTLGFNNTSVALGLNYAIALKANGSVVGSSGSPATPSGAQSGVVAIAAGNNFNLALKADGSVVPWGSPSSIMTLPSAAQSGVVAIAAGSTHALALRADGTLVTWGDDWNSSLLTIPSSAASGVVAIAAGSNCSFALLANGSVVAWGNFTPSFTFKTPLVAPPSAPFALREGTNRIDVRVTTAPTRPLHEATLAAGSTYNVIATADGFAQRWAVTTGGASPSAPPAAAQTGVFAVYARGSRQFALSASGYVVDLNGGSVPASLSATNVGNTGFNPARSLALGNFETLALRFDGTVLAWQNDVVVPSDARSGIIAVAANPNSQLFALRQDGRLVKWSTSGTIDTTLPAATQSNVVAIAAGSSHGLVLKADGTLFAWNYSSPAAVSPLTQIPVDATDILSIAAADDHFLALRRDGRVFAWGNVGSLNTVPAAAQAGVLAIAAGPSHALALCTDGQILSWGSGPGALQSYSASSLLATPSRTYTLVVERAVGSPGLAHLASPAGALTPAFASGNLTYTLPATPYPTLGLAAMPRAPLGLVETRLGGEAFSARMNGPTLAVADNLILAVTPAGAVQRFGSNSYLDTIPAAAQANVVAVTAGLRHAVVLKRDGSLFAWGESFENKLNVPGGTDFVAVAAGLYHTLALTTDGRVVAWGQSFLQQLVVPATATDVVAIAAGERSSMALRRNGAVVAWGNGSTFPQSIPTDAQSGVVAIAAGSYHFIALRADGRVVQWGDTSGFPAAPTQGVVAIAAHGRQNLALRADGSVVSWGASGSTAITVPAAASSGVAAIALCYTHGAALRQDGTLLALSGSNPSLTSSNGTPTFAGPFALPLSAPQALGLGGNTLQMRFSRFDASLPPVTYEFAITRLPAPGLIAVVGTDPASLERTAYTFAPGAVGVNSSEQIFTVSNPGTADLIVDSITITGAAAADFTPGGTTFPLTVAPGALATFSVTATPGAVGLRTASLVFNANLPGGETRTFAMAVTGFTVASEIENWRFGGFTAEELADPALEASVWGDLADPDGDGVPNLLEYATASDARSPGASPATVVSDNTTPEAPKLVLTYTRVKRAAAAGLLYHVEWSDTLQGGSWSALDTTEQVTASTATTETVSVSVPAAVPSRFMRLRVVR